jgi:hypothetical protein
MAIADNAIPTQLMKDSFSLKRMAATNVLNNTIPILFTGKLALVSHGLS